jgi:hypothetical protein
MWTFRLPTKIPISALNNVQIDVSSNNKIAKFQHKGNDYQLLLGVDDNDVTDETESFRVLVPKPKTIEDDDDDDDDDDDEQQQRKASYLQLCAKGFSKHFNVLADLPELTETQLAPREGPPARDYMFHAYEPVKQRTGLKRRWMPLGVPSPATSTIPSKASVVKTETVDDDDDDDDSASSSSSPSPTKRIKVETSSKKVKSEAKSAKKEAKSAKKAAKSAVKAEKKAMKKDKKEAKKAKKDKSKIKKEES